MLYWIGNGSCFVLIKLHFYVRAHLTNCMKNFQSGLSMKSKLLITEDSTVPYLFEPTLNHSILNRPETEFWRELGMGLIISPLFEASLSRIHATKVTWLKNFYSLVHQSSPTERSAYPKKSDRSLGWFLVAPTEVLGKAGIIFVFHRPLMKYEVCPLSEEQVISGRSP